MTDYTAVPLFTARVQAFHTGLDELAGAGIPDAGMLLRRGMGWNNLQGHFRSIVPLSLWLLERQPDLGADIRNVTDIAVDMTNGSTESRLVVWRDVQAALIDEMRTNGGDRIVEGEHRNSPETPRRIARTYLSDAYGGGQTSGGAGNTVLKRSLKLAAHLFPFS